MCFTANELFDCSEILVNRCDSDFKDKIKETTNMHVICMNEPEYVTLTRNLQGVPVPATETQAKSESSDVIGISTDFTFVYYVQKSVYKHFVVPEGSVWMNLRVWC